MNKYVFIAYISLLAICISGYAATPVASPLLKTFFEHPSEKGLKEIRKACQAGALQQDEDAYMALRGSPNLANPYVIRALVRMHDGCNDAATAEDAIELLGVHVLLAHPETLLDALAKEQAPYDFIEQLAAARPNSFDCGRTPGCTESRPMLYKNKIAAIEAVKADESASQVQQELILRMRNEINQKYEE